MDLQTFKATFPDIRVHLDWAAVHERGHEIQTTVLTDPAELGQVYSAFQESLGRLDPHFLHWILTRKITLAEAMLRFHELPDNVQSDIELMRQECCAAAEPVRLDVPACRLPRNGFYLLDGNHRCTAVLMSGRAFEVKLHVIQGAEHEPISPDIGRCRERRLPSRITKKVP
ncbi:hypothetical protein [Cucumibacter marinus]|uniref:hypothetical protein n=1 Tax=Cucumibacter marinus TaxID=1121252 RepID=UPI00048EDF5B|nr:hypothetical protein [Cucumibacter marinus]